MQKEPIIAFPPQEWLCERATILGCKYSAYLVIICVCNPEITEIQNLNVSRVTFRQSSQRFVYEFVYKFQMIEY